jgi:anti-sigma regulatory factor (Ser/Thr protein kinase)
MAISGEDRRREPDPAPVDWPMTGTSPPWGGEPLDDIRPPLRADAVATPQDAARLRHELAAWLSLDVPDEPLEDLVLATYEAIANAAEHAYVDHIDTAGPIRLHAHRRPACVTVTVVDEGTWRMPTGQGFRSRGLALMHLLVPDLHIGPNEIGTTVHLRMWLPVSGLAQ